MHATHDDASTSQCIEKEEADDMWAATEVGHMPAASVRGNEAIPLMFPRDNCLLLAHYLIAAITRGIVSL